MDELTRFEYQKKACFADIGLEAIANEDDYYFRDIAKDEDVKETSQIFAAEGYSDRKRIMPYVVKYGYENVNAFVRELIARTPQKDAEE